MVQPPPEVRAYCRHESLLALSCKQRCLCPSCRAKCQEAFGEFVTEEILAAVPHRDAVISLPRRLRPPSAAGCASPAWLAEPMRRSAISSKSPQAPAAPFRAPWPACRVPGISRAGIPTCISWYPGGCSAGMGPSSRWRELRTQRRWRGSSGTECRECCWRRGRSRRGRLGISCLLSRPGDRSQHSQLCMKEPVHTGKHQGVISERVNCEPQQGQEAQQRLSPACL